MTEEIQIFLATATALAATISWFALRIKLLLAQGIEPRPDDVPLVELAAVFMVLFTALMWLVVGG